MRDFKIGDEVRVKNYETLIEEFGDNDMDCGGYYFEEDMKSFCGKIITVTLDNLDNDVLDVKNDKNTWSLTPNMVDFLNDCKIKEEPQIRENQLIFAKTKPNAIIPTKRDEDAGYDIYTCETETIVIPPNTTRMIDTGIAIACNQAYFPKFFDKGGMGSKGVIVGAGVGDSGYRDGYFVPLINTNGDKYVVITNQSQEEIDNSTYFDLEINKFTVLKNNHTHSLNLKQLCSINSGFGLRFIPKADCIIKPLNKAITQFAMLPVPKMEVSEISWEELKSIKSERGLGKLGSSCK